jgi:excisionase family DNA binding protein
VSAEEPLISTAEVARRLGVAVRTINSWAAEGKLRAAVTTIGGHRRWLWSEVQQQLREQRQRPE